MRVCYIYSALLRWIVLCSLCFVKCCIFVSTKYQRGEFGTVAKVHLQQCGEARS